MIDRTELERLEERVQHALATASDEGLRVLGYGEITLVLGWPPDRPRLACKRLPVFADEAAARRFGETVDRYVDELRHRGVDVLDTAFGHTPTAGGKTAAYVVQPALPVETLVPSVLARTEPDPGNATVNEILERVVAVVDDRVGFDAQVSNWAVTGDRLRYFDVTTPILRGEDGRSAIDLDLFLAALPWALRGAVRRFVVPGVLARYHDRRSVMRDLAANLLKERLDPWIPAVVQAASLRLDAPITPAEVRKDYASDARLWAWLLRLRRADRWWQRRIRRRTYPFLLPGPIER